MPFEPLQTDEKLDSPVPRKPDMDAQLLAGCTGFVLASIGSYGLSIWPFFTGGDVYRAQGLLTACLMGFAPATLYGALLVRRFGLAGACGFFAGAMATALFLIFRLQQLFMAAQMKPEFAPEYPTIMPYLLGGAWVVWSALVGLLLMPKGELPGKNE